MIKYKFNSLPNIEVKAKVILQQYLNTLSLGQQLSKIEVHIKTLQENDCGTNLFPLHCDGFFGYYTSY